MRYVLFSLFCFAVVSCSNESEAEKMARQISESETRIGGNPRATDEEVRSLLGQYDAYAAHTSADTILVVDYLLRGGDMSSRVKEYERALDYYDSILKKFPHNPKAPKALFMKGYTLDNMMGKLQAAKVVYQSFLEKYPSDKLANSVEFSLKNLGKSPEEIIREFEAKAKEE